MPRCRCASSSPQAGCCIDHKPTGTSSQKIASNPSATRDMASDHRIQKKHTGQTMTSEKEGTHEVAIPKDMEQKPPPQKLYVYSCPFCQKSVTTSIVSGHVNHRRVCGRQFRVQDGLLRPTLPATRFSHICPTCGTCVQSTKEFGRIQSKHKQSNGRVCPRTEWHAQ